VKTRDALRGLAWGGGSFQTSAWMSWSAFAPVYPAQSSTGAPTARSHEEAVSDARAISPTASATAAGMPPVASASSVPTASARPRTPPSMSPKGKSQRKIR